MNFTLSNASACIGRAAAGLAAAAPTTAPAEPPPTNLEVKTTLGMLAVGICLAAVWLVRRLIYPRKLSLARAPGRANTLHPAHVVLLLLGFILFGGWGYYVLHRWIGLSEGRAFVAAVAADSAFLLVASLALAASTFRFGIVRGLGLSARHWIYDALRAGYGYLAVFPVCVGLMEAFARLLPKDWHGAHPMLTALDSLPPAWRVLVAAVAVVLVPVSEEVFFRGLVQSMLRRYLHNAWAAVLVASAVFASLHYATPQFIPALFALAVVLGYHYERSGRLLSPILIHLLFNAVSVAFYILRVS
jgi:membrane protease YdiL (CAAX protease family)